MSMIENLESIKKIGLNAFIKDENERWRCIKCGGVICVHRGYCFSCGEKVKRLPETWQSTHEWHKILDRSLKTEYRP